MNKGVGMVEWRDDLKKILETESEKKNREEQLAAANNEYIQKKLSEAFSEIIKIVQNVFPELAAKKSGMTMPYSGNGMRIGLELASKSLNFELNHGNKAIIIMQNGTMIDRVIWNFHGEFLTSDVCNKSKTAISNIDHFIGQYILKYATEL